MGYDEEKVIDFFVNERTDVRWDQLADMIYDRFGSESMELAGCLAKNDGGDLIPADANEKLNKAKDLINSILD
jgi:hypothetical protein